MNKTIATEWLTVDKTSFCLRGSAEECQQNAKSRALWARVRGACRARRDVKIKLHPWALCVLRFAYGGRIAACIVSVRWLAEGERVWRHYAECTGRHWWLQTQTNQCWSNTQQTPMAAILCQWVVSPRAGLIHCQPDTVGIRFMVCRSKGKLGNCLNWV